MKKLFSIILVTIFVLLVVASCNNACPISSISSAKPSVSSKEPEKQRYRVKVTQHLEDYTYIVEKYGYTYGGIYCLDSSRELKIGEIVYVIQINYYDVMLFEDYIDYIEDIEE
jgi:hypothetical protein